MAVAVEASAGGPRASLSNRCASYRRPNRRRPRRGPPTTPRRLRQSTPARRSGSTVGAAARRPSGPRGSRRDRGQQRPAPRRSPTAEVRPNRPDRSVGAGRLRGSIGRNRHHRRSSGHPPKRQEPKRQGPWMRLRHAALRRTARWPLREPAAELTAAAPPAARPPLPLPARSSTEPSRPREPPRDAPIPGIWGTRECAREAVRLLVGDRARCRWGFREAAVSVVRARGSSISLVDERHEGAGRGTLRILGRPRSVIAAMILALPGTSHGARDR